MATQNKIIVITAGGRLCLGSSSMLLARRFNNLEVVLEEPEFKEYFPQAPGQKNWNGSRPAGQFGTLVISRFGNALAQSKNSEINCELALQTELQPKSVTQVSSQTAAIASS